MPTSVPVIQPTFSGLKADIIRFESDHIENGEFVSDKLLNGDEKMALRFGNMPGVYMLELYKY